MDDDGLIEAIYRARPETLAELASTVHEDEARVAASLEALATRGAVTVRADGALAYRNPVAWAASVVTRESAALRAESAAALARIEGVVAGLPDLARHWAIGESATQAVPVLTRHGERAADDLWYDTSSDSTGAAMAVFPDVRRFLSSDPGRSARFAEALAQKSSARAVVPRRVADDPALRDVALRFADSGVQFRVLDDPPSWFWIDGDLLALPLLWGEGWPTSIVALRNAALAGLGASLFERLWGAAIPLEARDEPWTPLLHLMRQGMTLDAASRTLGIHPRTGRRRVAAGMAHYGVSTLFGLGAAWAQDARTAPRG